MNLSNTAFLNIHCVDYHCIINGITKNKAVNVWQNADLSKKVKHCKICLLFTVHER